jgi:phosphoribosylaminoimidazole-succinocarboxamide synthase
MATAEQDEVVLETHLRNPLFSRGKVRDTYDLGDDLLIITTDRVSAFDVVLPCGIPGKGEVLTRISEFWFNKTSHLLPNHMLEIVEDAHQLRRYRAGPGCSVYPPYLAGRSMIVKRAEPVMVECVVRGYITGSGWADYQKTGVVSGVDLPAGLKECEKLPEPIFTPTTKAEEGHDLPMTMEEVENQVGQELAHQLREKSLALYEFVEKYARDQGIIIADTKMEFGFIDGELNLIDELFTPDSSRFWDAEVYTVGQSQPSFDKQIIRDWLEESGWNKEPPAPMLSPEIIERTSERYREVYKRLTGQSLKAGTEPGRCI